MIATGGVVNLLRAVLAWLLLVLLMVAVLNVDAVDGFPSYELLESSLPAWPLPSTAFVNILRAAITAITFLAKFLKYPAQIQL